MNFYLRKFFYCFLFFICFFSSINIADADGPSFTLSLAGKHCTCEWSRSTVQSCGPNGDEAGVCRGVRYIYNSFTGSPVYCSDSGNSFYGNAANGTIKKIPNNNIGNFSYKEDSEYSTSNVCSYGDGKNNGDCSLIIGYIIKHAQDRFVNPALNMSAYYWTQLTVWTYINEFTRLGYAKDNWPYKSLYDLNYMGIGDVIRSAWNDYEKNAVVPKTVKADLIDLKIDNNLNFYYVPSNSETCSSNGSYQTNIIKVINKVEKNIVINISTSTEQHEEKNVYICSTENGVEKCDSSKEGIEIFKKGEYSFYLKTFKDINRTINLKVNASFTDDYSSTGAVVDSIRYIYDGYIINNKSPQGVIVPISTSNITGKTKYVDSDNVISFTQNAITRYACNSNTKSISKVCASDTIVSNSDDYTANFSGCTCLGLNLGNDRYVNILVGENVAFRYGNLIPNKDLYGGGGFEFDTSGISTQYIAKISWKYANYIGGDYNTGIPYYYDKNNLNSYDARNVEQEIEKILFEKIRNDSNNFKVSLDFETYDSNDSSSTDYTLDFSLSGTSNSLDLSAVYNKDDKVYTLKSGNIQLKKAYFSKNGNVIYEEGHDDFSIDGGNKYYIPLGYNRNEFKFNINKVNLSIVDGINANYQASCSVNVVDKYTDLYYRSIDVSDPFPKAGKESGNVPKNWRLWYCGTGSTCDVNTVNAKRIKNSYQNYPNSPLYKVILNAENIADINDIDDYYTSWSNINADGSSNFVTKAVEFKINASNSYCGIGKFSKDCDK